MSNTKKVFKIMALIMAIIFVMSSTSVFVSAKETDETKMDSLSSIETKSNVDNVYNKIHFYFDSEENATIDDMVELKTATEKLTATKQNKAKTNDSNIQNINELKITIQFESDFMDTAEYKAFSIERDELDSWDQIHEFRERLNSFSKDYHKNLVNQNIDSLASLEYNDIEPIEYSPFVIIRVDSDKVDADALLDFAESENIVNVSLANEEQPESDVFWNNTLKELNAYEIVENETYTGFGVRIGIYESGGICDVTHRNLANKDITVRDSTKEVTSHATKVASILATIAPDAEYYVSDVDRIGIQWFIDEACDIVNCSFGYYNNFDPEEDGIYTNGVKEYRKDIDGVYDYQILAHFITVVKSAGNYNNNETSEKYNPENRITSPGYAYNVITVGGVKRTLSWFEYQLEYDDGASYLSSIPKVKPNVSAIFTVSIPNIGSDSGTSYATPQVAGCIALLEESNPRGYGVYPERILSVLTSTAQKTSDYNADVGNFDSRVGAGVIDLQRMIDSEFFVNEHNTDGVQNSELLSVEKYVQAGTELQVGLAWLVTAVNTSTTGINISEVYVTDYDLRIYAPSGALVSSGLTSSNVELVRLTATETGTYRIVLYQWGAINVNNEGDWISLTIN